MILESDLRAFLVYSKFLLLAYQLQWVQSSSGLGGFRLTVGMRFLPATVSSNEPCPLLCIELESGVHMACSLFWTHMGEEGERRRSFHRPAGQLRGSCTLHSWPPQLWRQLAAPRLHTRGGCFSKWKQWIPHSISEQGSPLCCWLFALFCFV